MYLSDGRSGMLDKIILQQIEDMAADNAVAEVDLQIDKDFMDDFQMDIE